MDLISSSIAIAITVAISLLLLMKLISFSSPSKKKKNLPPSPPSLPIIGHLHLLSKPLHRSLSHLSSLHGPLLLLRFGSRRVLLVSSAAHAEDCFTGPNDLAFASRPRLPSAQRLSYNYSTIASAPYGPHWRNLRRIATVEVLSSSRLLSFSAARSDEIRSLTAKLFHDWRRNSTSPNAHHWQSVHLRPTLFGVALNVIMRMLAGKRYYGEGAADGMEVRRFREMLEEGLSLIGASNLSDFLPFLRMVDFQGVNRRMAAIAVKSNEILQGLIDEHRRDGNMKTLISELLSLQKENPEYYTDQNIKALVVTLLFAGTDTSTETVEWAMCHLLNNPEAMQKAREEIEECVEEGRMLQESDLSNLPYLHAVINETLRLCPTAPLLVPHESLQDATVGGYDVLRGTIVLVNAWAIHRDPEIWANPTEFRPERFMDGGHEVGGKIIPFGMGRRRCPGEGLAMRVVGLELGTLLQCFEWERVGGREVDMKERGGITLLKDKPLETMYRPRERMMHVISQL